MKKSYVTKNYAWVEGKEIIVKARYSEEFVKDCREITGRRWSHAEKVNIFPLDALVEVRALADKWKIELPSEIRFKGGDTFSSTDRKFQVEMEDGKVTVSFDYNPKLIESIKASVPGIKWESKARLWRVPEKSVVDALLFASNNDMTISPELVEVATNIVKEAQQMREASEALHTDVQIEIPGLALDLLPYQLAGVNYLRKVRKGILGDQPGLGKTAISLATIASEQSFPLIVVCPNTLKINWEREIKKFFPKLTTSVLNGGKRQKIEPVDVIIVNYDILYNRNDDIIEHGFRSLIVDESHAIKNGQRKYQCPECEMPLRSNSTNCSGCKSRNIFPRETWTVKRTEAVIRLAKLQGAEDFTLLLTGTPITNRPDELIPQLEAVGKLEKFGGSWRFKQRYAPKRNLALNTSELNQKLREMCFVRRMKSDVYGELPPLRNAVQYMNVSSDKMDWYREVETDVVEYFAQRAKALAEDEGSDGTAAYWQKKITLEMVRNLVHITALRDAVSKIKYDTIVEWLDNFLESSDNEKVIVFAEHIEFVEKLFDRYKKVAVKIRGGVSTTARAEAVDRFQNDPTCRVFVANMTAASEGLTLTAASDVVFCELGWTPAIHEQCVSRCYGRANDLHGATAWYLLAPKTVDEDIYELLEKKKRVVDSVTNGVDVEDEGSVMGELVKTLAERGLASEYLHYDSGF